MPRGIDHLVLAVRDLDAACATYAALGFTLTPRAVHPFGTANSIVQLEGCFLELLELDDPAIIPPTDGPASFAQFNRDFLTHREGMSMLVLEGKDPAGEAEEFRGAGIAARDPFSFERDAKLPDGGVARVGFTLVFADFPHSSQAGFFTCTQHRPDLFWRPGYQKHANGACTIADVTLAAPDTARMAAFISSFVGAGAIKAEEGGPSVDTGRGRVGIVAAGDNNASEPRFLSCRLLSRDLARVAHHAREAGIPFSETESGLEFEPEVMYGVRVTFSDA